MSAVGNQEASSFEGLSSKDFLDFVLKGKAFDGKLESYKKEVEDIFNLGLSGEQLTRRLTNESAARVDIDTTDWDGVSAKTLLNQMYEETSKLRKFNKADRYGSFYELITILTDMGSYGDFLTEKFTKEEIEKIGSFIIPERDELFTYIGIRMLFDRYLARGFEPRVVDEELGLIDYDEHVYELPQERFLIIAMTIMQDEISNRLELIEEAYWALSNLYMTVATPTLSNSGKTHGQLSSCFIDTVDDSLDGIYLDNWDTARVSKSGGGVGIYLGKVRALNSSIKRFKGKASGVIPWVKNINSTAISVDQLGQRQGAVAIYLDIFHKDILSFLQIGTNNGDERLKARDVFPGICIPDYFMELIEADENGRMLTPDAPWYLFDPHEVRQVMGFSLEDCYDEEEGAGTWRTRYQECINNKLLSRKELPVKQLVQSILVAQLETGNPYMFYRDEVNRKNPNKHMGMIYCSNLCTEITQNMSATNITKEYTTEDGKIIIERTSGDYVVCNLSSINLGRAWKDKVIERLIRIQVRMLDNVIDNNNLPLGQATVTNKKYRPIGLGTFGWHHVLAVAHIDWNSIESVNFADELYEEIAFYTLRSSMELAREKGAYPVFEGSDFNTGAYFEIRGYKTEGSRFDWDWLKEEVKKGIRNGHLLAVAPNSSTGLIAGSTQGIDPFYGAQGIYFEEKKDFKIPVVAPDLSPETFPYYFRKNAHNIDKEITILQNAKRQRHIDQAVSFNLYVRNDIKGKDLMQLHRMIWRNKIKTSYYVRNTANEAADDCEACQ